MITREQITSDVIEMQERLAVAINRGHKDRRNAFVGTSKISGYVCKIHGDDDPDEDLVGTVDVQEYGYHSDDYDGQPVGFHEGVFISSIQGNNGYKIVPCLFSEVIISQDPSTLQWYVMMYSHATIIDLKAHDEINIAVTEYEPFEESDDGLKKDYDELEETGKKSSVKHTALAINTEVLVDDEGLKQEITAEHKTIEVGDTKIFIDGENVTIETSKQITVKSENVDVEGSTVTIKGDVTIKDGSLTTKGTSNTDLNGPYNAVKVCPFSGAPHCGSVVSGT